MADVAQILIKPQPRVVEFEMNWGHFQTSIILNQA
jgi:hypothetical protein